MHLAQWALATILLLIAFWTIRRTTQFKQSQDDLIRSLPAGPSQRWFRVNVARPAYFARRIKLLGFQARGVLIDEGTQVRLLAIYPDGARLDQAYPKSDLGLTWVGNQGLSSANMHWFALGHGDQRQMVCADTGFNALQSREAAADICRMIAPDFPLPVVASQEFALEKNRTSLAVIVAMLVLLAFALIDGVILNRNEMLDPGPWSMYGLILGPLLALVAFFRLGRAKVPARESVGLALLLLLALSAVHFPLVKRVDEVLMLASGGVQTHRYVLGADARLEALHSREAPKLNFSGAREYWAQFAEGSEHDFEFIHGPLGTWQLVHDQLDPRYQAFYTAAQRR